MAASCLRLAEEVLSDGRTCLLNDGFTMADIAVAYAIEVAFLLSREDQLPPHCMDWFARMKTRDGYNRAKAVQAKALAQSGERGLIV